MADTIVLVGSESLMGRELRDLLSGNAFGADVRLVAGGEDAAGVLSKVGGEATVVARLDLASLADASAIILAGTAESSAAALALLPEGPFIDLTYVAEDNPRSRLRAPMAEPFDFQVLPGAIHSVAHPAAIALAMVLNRVDPKFKVARWTAHIFEPASERGTAGIEELQAQTVSLLSFKSMPRKVFDTQVSFSMLAALGAEASVQLEEIETRIERHLTTLLENAGRSPMPSLRLVQAPVFHGYSLSVWMEFEGLSPETPELEALLATDDVNVRDSSVEPPNNVGIAGQDGITLGAIMRDRNNPRALWLWIAADNLRLAAENALLVARDLV